VNPRLTKTLWLTGAVSSVLIALISYRYFVPEIPAPDSITSNPMAHPWLWVHAGFAATALLVGPWQFLGQVRARWPKVHRWIGRTYVFACLIGGFAGLLIASGSTAGPIARAGFGLLAVVWLGVNIQAYSLALARRFPEHREWMIRSFALTFAAVTLRIEMPLAAVLHLDPLASYRAISWLAWVPNLALAELYLRGLPLRRRSAPALP
jgi:hypothetical protein